MSQFINLLTLTRLAPAPVVAKTFVGYDGATAVAGGNALGVADYDAAAGEAYPVVVLGTAIVTAGAAIAKDAPVEVGAGGRAVTLDEGQKVGIALEAAAQAGDEIEVLLLQN